MCCTEIVLGVSLKHLFFCLRECLPQLFLHTIHSVSIYMSYTFSPLRNLPFRRWPCRSISNFPWSRTPSQDSFTLLANFTGGLPVMPSPFILPSYPLFTKSSSVILITCTNHLRVRTTFYTFQPLRNSHSLCCYTQTNILIHICITFSIPS